ncbi:hypothetical protein HIM_09889 [Hirsutella minnesotensis 3608]|uniref:Reverse transcriptase domain-containing protein n=1 Tax=Hirsutella minnesotensis 3608 TaxID=1043627 RepID=A0A0F7ZKR2_9HYPO|nr:hypothetical protein HIM_09889 [Hirsutella minnesotensis 3608]
MASSDSGKGFFVRLLPPGRDSGGLLALLIGLETTDSIPLVNQPIMGSYYVDGFVRGAAKEYHDNVRKQKKSHWDDLVTDENNIWKVAKYLKPGADMLVDKVPSLRRADGSITKGKGEQGEELLRTFFPPLPTMIEPEGERPQREAVTMPDLTLQEIEEKVMAAKSWKAPGEDGLPAIVWKKLWHVVKYRVWTLFDSSLREGVVPHQWRTAKIIPLKKPDKDDYRLAKAWRPISLLSTLGKILEAVVAERISYAAEAHGLLPANHFGARKRRSADQALALLQERIYKAWRMGRVLSLVSFDVKGAYNGVCKERLLERMEARGIPSRLVKWVDAFCSERTASVVVNGYTSEQQALAQAGLPQGSPLSPVAFLFFNADLVQRRISNNGGSIAFVDDYSAWVTGPTAESNRDGIQSIIDDALDWEKRSGATFEVNKTSVIHFTRIAERDSNSTFAIRGDDVKPKDNVKLLGVIMDQALRFKEHIAGVAAKGLTAAMCLKRLKMASPRTARQLFTATVAPTMDYASNVWSHACKTKEATWIERAQRVGAQAITGGFRTSAVAEAEAGMQSFRERHAQATAKFWIRTQTLSNTHPLTSLRLKLHRRLDTKRVEVIHEFALAPCDERVQATYETDRLEALTSDDPEDITTATSSSQRKGKVGLGGVVRDASRDSANGVVASYSVTLGPSGEQNAYTAGLEAIATTLRCVPLGLRDRDLTVVTSNRSVLQVIGRQQSGQCTIRAIYGSVEFLAKRGCKVRLRWVPAKSEEYTLGPLAKRQAKRATRDECIAEPAMFQARSTTLRMLLNEHSRVRQISEGVGKYSKRIDEALPGKHTRKLNPRCWYSFELIWNMDEMGFRIGVGKDQLIVTKRKRAHDFGIPENRESAADIEAISASGACVPPFLILSGQMHMSSWYHVAELDPETAIRPTPTGYSDDEISLEWLQHFGKHSAKTSKGSKRLLILDGHGSHHTRQFIQYCDEHGIIPFGMPPNLTHVHSSCLQSDSLTLLLSFECWWTLVRVRAVPRHFVPGSLPSSVASSTNNGAYCIAQYATWPHCIYIIGAIAVPSSFVLVVGTLFLAFSTRARKILRRISRLYGRLARRLSHVALELVAKKELSSFHDRADGRSLGDETRNSGIGPLERTLAVAAPGAGERPPTARLAISCNGPCWNGREIITSRRYVTASSV